MTVEELVLELLTHNQKAEVFLGLDTIFTDAFQIAKIRPGVVDKSAEGVTFDVGPSELTEDWRKDGFEVFDIIDNGYPALIIYPLTEDNHEVL